MAQRTLTPEQQTAYDELHAHVAQIMNQARDDALAKLHAAIYDEHASPDLIADHMAAAGPWVTPKDFCVAFLRHTADQYMPPLKGGRLPRKFNMTIAKYRRLF